jgi:hypothetical protein
MAVKYNLRSLPKTHPNAFNDTIRHPRIGGTVSIPLTKHQSVKFSYSDGEFARIGGTFQTVSVAWQYSWLGRPK